MLNHHVMFRAKTFPELFFATGDYYHTTALEHIACDRDPTFKDTHLKVDTQIENITICMWTITFKSTLKIGLFRYL